MQKRVKDYKRDDKRKKIMSKKLAKDRFLGIIIKFVWKIILRNPQKKEDS